MSFFRRKRRNELHCHACDNYVQFVIDQGLDGNHVLDCPNCGHEHCRVVKNGLVTDDRWDSRNGPTFHIPHSATAYSTFATITSGSASYFIMMTDTYGAGGTTS